MIRIHSNGHSYVNVRKLVNIIVYTENSNIEYSNTEHNNIENSKYLLFYISFHELLKDVLK